MARQRPRMAKNIGGGKSFIDISDFVPGGGGGSPEESPLDDITIKLGEPPRTQDTPVVNGNGNGGAGLGGPAPPPPPPDQSNPAIFGPVDTPQFGPGPKIDTGGVPAVPAGGGARTQRPQTKQIIRGRLLSGRKSEWIKMGGIDGIS